eukprot:m.426887 g.426887  ORF g.426887 m.426887 type:complete len:260 (-) comp21359_c0_seq8:1692-2471(-)
MGQQGHATLSAVIFLDDGEQCRCLKLRKTDKVSDVIKKMQEVEADWRLLGDATRPSTTLQPSVQQKNYRLVACTKHSDSTSGQVTNASVREEVLSNDLIVGSDRFREIRETWSKLFVRHLVASFAHGRGIASRNKPTKNTSGNSPLRRPREKKTSKPTEYWFVCPRATAKNTEVRVKLVDMDRYKVVKGKRGWMHVVAKGVSKKTPSVWVVLQENRLSIFADTDESSEPLCVSCGKYSHRFYRVYCNPMYLVSLLICGG